MNKKAIARIAFEFISVVFAVLLALGLNSYKQSVDAEDEALILKSSILKECTENLIKIDSFRINNSEYYSYLDSLVNLGEDEVDDFFFQANIELLTNGAWTIAQNNSSINRLNQEFLIEAAEIYQTQEFYSEFSVSFFENVGNYLNRQDEVTPYTTALSLYFNMNVLNNSAEELSKQYMRFLRRYDNDSIE